MWSWIGKRRGFVIALIYIAQIIYCHFNKNVQLAGCSASTERLKDHILHKH